MAEDQNNIWLERWLGKIPLPVPVTSLFIGTVIFLVYFLFSRYVIFFEWNFYHQYASAVVSILIAYQLAGIFYLMGAIRENFRKLDHFYASSEFGFCKILEDKFKSHCLYYLLILYFITPFLAINGLTTPYLDTEMNNFGLLLDIYNNLLIYLSLFLLSTIHWIILNMAWSLREAGKMFEISSINGNVFSSELKLKSLKSFIVKIICYYFICISLAMATYLTPSGLSFYETILFFILLLIGATSFFGSLDAIQGLISKQIERELEPINIKITEQIQKLKTIVTQKNCFSQREEIDLIIPLLENLHKERAELLSIRIYDIRSIGTFIAGTITSIIPATIALILKMND
jgi:hypothetical protein